MTCGTFFWSLWISSRVKQVVTLGLGDPRIEWLRLMSSLLEELFDTRVFMYQILVECKPHTNHPLWMVWIDVLGVLEGTLPLHINVKFSGVFYHFHSCLLLIMNHFYPTFHLYFFHQHTPIPCRRFFKFPVFPPAKLRWWRSVDQLTDASPVEESDGPSGTWSWATFGRATSPEHLGVFDAAGWSGGWRWWCDCCDYYH